MSRTVAINFAAYRAAVSLTRRAGPRLARSVAYRIHSVIEVRETQEFAQWLGRLRDDEARARILSRVRRLSLGNPGDVRPVGEGVSEMRIDYGPGYRLYYVSRGTSTVVLLIGGDKKSQRG